ncbi:hypothetical protein F5I97DRAFT_1417124 [Phlebopus sp. FC_14]|nr:hypothetical protein F5I97DRAFT_1417124 [Phlebopus sp. FC_14]
MVPVSVIKITSNSAAAWLTNLGAGVTTINIIIISFALYPVASLLSDLRTEEFFRILNERRDGHRNIPLSAINGISNPSYGLVDSTTVVIRRHCSGYFATGFLAAGAAWAVSALAPAALSVQPVLADGPIMAFSVGSIPPMSLYQPVAAQQTTPAIDPAAGFSAGVIWAERELNTPYSFSVSNESLDGYAGYIVPTPPNLNSTVTARWLTDVVGLNPYCTWATPNLTETSTKTAMNKTDKSATAVSVYLQGLDLDVSVMNDYFPLYDSNYVASINVLDPTVSIVNHTTGNLPTDGSLVLTIVQCTQGCTGDAINMFAIFVDFTDIPFLTFTAPGAIYEMAFLVCKPNPVIETREVRTVGSMTVEVQPPPSGQTYPRQGNLDFSQTALLMSYSLSELSYDSGPASSEWYGLGSATQVDFLFGWDQMDNIVYGVDYDNTSTTITLLSIDQITPVYTQMVQGAMKPYVSGTLATAYVPGRVASVKHIFTSSMPHVVASTILFVLLSTLSMVAHFRKGKGNEFTLLNVAAIMRESELPEIVEYETMAVVSRRSRRHWTDRNVGHEVADRLKDKRVVLEGRGGGLNVLNVSQ